MTINPFDSFSYQLVILVLQFMGLFPYPSKVLRIENGDTSHLKTKSVRKPSTFLMIAQFGGRIFQIFFIAFALSMCYEIYNSTDKDTKMVCHSIVLCEQICMTVVLMICIVPRYSLLLKLLKRISKLACKYDVELGAFFRCFKLTFIWCIILSLACIFNCKNLIQSILILKFNDYSLLENNMAFCSLLAFSIYCILYSNFIKFMESCLSKEFEKLFTAVRNTEGKSCVAHLIDNGFNCIKDLKRLEKSIEIYFNQPILLILFSSIVSIIVSVFNLSFSTIDSNTLLSVFNAIGFFLTIYIIVDSPSPLILKVRTQRFFFILR